MKQIRLLDPTVANQIAAGEVVTRPSAVVKELLENAVDAAAKNITLSISQAGEAIIQVVDDGCGILPEEVPLAFARHATSKISSSADIFKIKTLGFRGEALASIASVAEVEMKTKALNCETGIKVLVKECKILSSEEVAMQQGTSVTVYNLFYNTPARRKFLKNDSYEKRLCLDEFEHVALANPNISFTLKLDNQQPLFYPECILSDRVRMLAKKKVSDNLMGVSLQTDILNVEGWITAPQCQMQGTHGMYFFVNGRYMNPRFLYRAVTSAYGKLLPEGKSIPCYLYLSIDPESIDVNVHPTKAEIKFDNEKEIWDLIRTAVRKAIGSSYDIPTLDFDKSVNIEIPAYSSEQSKSTALETGNYLRNYNPFEIPLDDSKYTSTDLDAERIPFKEHLPSGMYIPKCHDDGDYLVDVKSNFNNISSEIIRLEGKYFAVKYGPSLVIIDYARAQERIEYERFLSNLKSINDCTSQRLLIPETISLSIPEAEILIDNYQSLSKIGFEIGNMGSGVIALYSVPSSLSSSGSYKKIIEEMADGLMNVSQSACSLNENMAMAVAKTYLNRRDIPTDMELKTIAKDIFDCSEPKLTPSSQLPTMWTISEDDIVKIFKR